MPLRNRLLLACALATLLLGLVQLPALPAAAATPAPSGLKAVSASNRAIALAWTPVKGAPKYRVQYSTSSKLKNPTYRRFTTPYAEITGLKPGTAYYLRVRSITASGANLSSYSKPVKVRTATPGGYNYLSPTGLTATGGEVDSSSLRWDSRGDGVRYRVSWSTSSSFASPAYARVTGTAYTLTGLAAGRKYYVKVRVIDANGANLSSYSPAISTTTRTSASGDSGTAPTGLKVTATARSAAALSWTAVAGAERYRVQYSASASMSSPQYVRSPEPGVEIAGLAAGTKYYFKVRVIAADGTNLSPYSPAVSATTATSTAASYLAPTGTVLTTNGPNKLDVAWRSRGSGLSYEVVYADNADLRAATSLTTTSTTTTISGLDAATSYWAKVRVVSATRTALSPFSATATGRTPGSVPSALRVASYNVKCANCYSALANEGTWYQRRDAVVANILAQKPDVIGIQEASQAWLKADDGKGSPISLSQFEDLTNRLGSPYKLTNTNRNNCVKSTTPTNCEYKDQGASQGTRIIYDSSRLTLLSQGSTRLSEIRAADNDRYVAWAILEQKSSGKRFFFADTHLEPASGPDYYTLRITQAKELLAVVTAKNQGLPTYVVGDFNSNKWTSPSNGPYDVLAGAGFVDPLGNAYRSTSSAPGATVGTRIRTNFASYNGYNRRAPSVSYINASYIDYIWTSKGIGVPEWETVVDIDANGDFIGTIPSDHNLIRATTTLP